MKRRRFFGGLLGFVAGALGLRSTAQGVEVINVKEWRGLTIPEGAHVTINVLAGGHVTVEKGVVGMVNVHSGGVSYFCYDSPMGRQAAKLIKIDWRGISLKGKLP